MSRVDLARSSRDANEASILAAVESAIIEKLIAPLDESLLGPKARIYYYKHEQGPTAKDFIDGLGSAAQASYLALFRRHCDGQIVRGTHHHVWEDHEALWSYKHRQSKSRILHTMERGNIYILLFGFTGKTENKVDSKHVNFAMRLQSEYKRHRDDLESHIRIAYGRGGLGRG